MSVSNTVPIDEFLNGVLPLVSGCPATLARTEVLNAAIEFCQQTMYNCWDVPPQDIKPDMALYELTAPPDHDICYLIRLDVIDQRTDPAEHQPIQLVPRRQLDQKMPNWRDMGGTNANQSGDWLPRYAFQADPGWVRLVPTPSVEIKKALAAFVALQPRRDAETLWYRLHSDFAETLQNGALARIMAMPGQDWSAPQLSQYYRQRFDQNVTEAKVAAMNDNLALVAENADPVTLY